MDSSAREKWEGLLSDVERRRESGVSRFVVYFYKGVCIREYLYFQVVKP